VRDFLVERLTRELEQSYARCARRAQKAPSARQRAGA